MIFYIDDTVFSEPQNNDDVLRWCRFIKLVTMTAETGEHLVFTHPNSIGHVDKLGKIDDHSKFILKSIARRSVFTYNELIDRCHIRFSINTAKDEQIDVLKTNPDQIKKILSKTHIILEDIDDNFIYEYILKSYIKHSNIKVNYSYNPVHGGGDGTFRLIEQYLASSENVFTIYDTDKKHPKDKIGKTARQIIRELHRLGIPQKSLAIDCHEVENLYPLCVYEAKADKNQILTINFLKQAINLKADAHQYFDYKKSHKYKHIFTEQTAHSEYWQELYLSSSDEFTKLSAFVQGQKTEDSIITPSLSTLSGLLKKDLQSKQLDHSKIDSIIPESLRSIWLSIGSTVLNWTISDQPIRI